MTNQLQEAFAYPEAHTSVGAERVPADMAAYLLAGTTTRVRLKFSIDGKAISLSLETGLYALLDGIAVQEEMSLGNLVRLIAARRNPRHSMREAACSFVAHYYYLKAHAPMQDALPVAFQTPPLRLRKRSQRLNRQLFHAWRELTGCWSARYPEG